MSPPPLDDLPDDLIDAYRRASQSEATQPSARVRTLILSRAAHGSKTSQRAPVRGRVLSWQWKAAASLAVVGLVGVLTSQILQAPRQDPGREQSAASAPTVSKMPESAPTAAANIPAIKSATNAPARKTTGAATPSSTMPTVSASRSMAVQEAAQEAAQEVPRAYSPATAPAGASARSADLVAQNSIVAQAPLDPWRSRTFEALRSSYPELFGISGNRGAAPGEPVQIALVLNEDGSIYKTAYEMPAGEDQASDGRLGERTPAVRLSLTLGVTPLELAAPARLMVFERGTGPSERIDVAVGIRKAH